MRTTETVWVGFCTTSGQDWRTNCRTFCADWERRETIYMLPVRSAWIRGRPTDHRRTCTRTAPLAGLWSHQKDGFYHDGRFATLPDVIEHYDGFFKLRLTDQEKRDLTNTLNHSSVSCGAGPALHTSRNVDLHKLGTIFEERFFCRGRKCPMSVSNKPWSLSSRQSLTPWRQPVLLVDSNAVVPS
jgi:hypothetical protein